MSGFRNAVYKFSIAFIFCLAGFILFYLFVLAGFSTSYIDIKEHVYLVRDNIWLNVFVTLLIIGGIYFASRKISIIKIFIDRVNDDYVFYNKCKCYMLCAIMLILIAIVVSLRVLPRADQFQICEAAKGWLNKNYDMMEQGQYLDRYPN